ncbi:MAG: hypothetical protein ACR2OO_04960 [Thermomicrobiales bacterium]
MPELGGLIAVGIVAAILRFWRLDGYPRIFSGDERQFGLSARRVSNGATTNPFSTGWFSHPNS